METINKIKNKKKIIVSSFIVGAVLLGAFLLSWRSFQVHRPANINMVEIGNIRIAVDTAITPKAQALGLSFRPALSEDEGMLFIFDKPGKQNFWMKDMNFPIDIIWISEDKKIVYIKKDARPELYPETYGGEQNSKYVLELVSGFSDKYNLKEGDKVSFE